MLKLIDDGLSADKALFTTTIATRWGDMDADGRINNMAILCYTEEARMQWADSLALHVLAPDLMPVVASVGGQFLAPIVNPCLLAVEIACSHLGKSSLQLQFRIFDSVSPHTHYAKAMATWVWVDKITKKPAAMPLALRERCAPSCREPAFSLVHLVFKAFDRKLIRRSR